MKVIIAKTAGFCFGVRNAVNTVSKQIQQHSDKRIYTYGPIINNEIVVKDFEKKGVTVINSKEELEKIKDGVIIIRSHGVSKSIYDLIEKNGLTVVDATCSDVKKIHKIVKKESDEGNLVIIFGNPNHPEVKGIRGWVKGESIVIDEALDVDNLEISHDRKIVIVAQTTFNYEKFKETVEIIEKKGYDISVLNTICNATRERQEEARKIAREVDAMIVIGDKHSSNTQKLFEICHNACKATYYIQTLEDLDLNQLESVETVGITAGASTPNTIIEEVQRNVRAIF